MKFYKNKKRTRKSSRTLVAQKLMYPARVKCSGVGTITYLQVETKELGELIYVTEKALGSFKDELLEYYEENGKWLTPVKTTYCNFTVKINILKSDIGA